VRDRLEAALATAVSRRPLQSDGKSGSTLERVTLADGTELVLKHVDSRRDWIMQATRDTGRIARLWEAGVFERVPATIDTAIVGIEPTPHGCTVIMRDVAASLLPDGAHVTRAQSRQLLAAAAALHRAFTRRPADDLCSLTDLLGFLSPNATAPFRAEHEVPRLVQTGWQRFGDVVARDVAEAVFDVLESPRLLADALARFDAALLHGDLKLANLGFAHDRVVVIDWGPQTSWGPPAVDYAWYVAVNGASVLATFDELVDDIRTAAGAAHDEDALRVAFLGALVQLGWEKALGATGDDDAVRRRERSGLDWWTARARDALEHWQPTRERSAGPPARQP
jgi:hypothetical protein